MSDTDEDLRSKVSDGLIYIYIVIDIFIAEKEMSFIKYLYK